MQDNDAQLYEYYPADHITDAVELLHSITPDVAGLTILPNDRPDSFRLQMNGSNSGFATLFPKDDDRPRFLLLESTDTSTVCTICVALLRKAGGEVLYNGETQTEQILLTTLGILDENAAITLASEENSKTSVSELKNSVEFSKRTILYLVGFFIAIFAITQIYMFFPVFFHKP